MNTRLLTALILCLCCANITHAQDTARPHITAINAGHLLDVDAGKELSNQIILISERCDFRATGPKRLQCTRIGIGLHQHRISLIY